MVGKLLAHGKIEGILRFRSIEPYQCHSIRRIFHYHFAHGDHLTLLHAILHAIKHRVNIFFSPTSYTLSYLNYPGIEYNVMGPAACTKTAAGTPYKLHRFP